MLHKARIAGGSVVLLSDGADTSKRAGLRDVVATARRAGVRVFTVGLKSRAYRPETLEALASATGGDYARASSPQSLTGIFDRLGATLSSQYLLRYRSFARPHERVTLEVRVRGEKPATSTYTSPALGLGAAPAFKRSVSDALWLSPAAVILVALLGGLLIGAIALLALRRRGNGLLERLSHFVPRSDHDELDAPTGAPPFAVRACPAAPPGTGSRRTSTSPASTSTPGCSRCWASPAARSSAGCSPRCPARAAQPCWAWRCRSWCACS